MHRGHSGRNRLGTQVVRELLKVCLADERGEELDLIVWEEGIKEEKGAQSFKIATGVTPVRRERSANRMECWAGRICHTTEGIP